MRVWVVSTSSTNSLSTIKQLFWAWGKLLGGRRDNFENRRNLLRYFLLLAKTSIVEMAITSAL